ncbi:MAG: DNA mismatch repair protein MutS [Bryobacteraceae bacterium]|nr:DNA mismatch repair protein MutS [Bryobacteraceae bacterium]MDW8378994.1 DNA mismatch repair protein MutS [Bryobacterales bacterium]
MNEPSTPLMRQYHALKQQVPDALLMFRLGDFYELFYEDAVIAARELEITLTSRNKEKGQAIPMCGVPYHAAESYLSKLIQKGYRVAICEQTEDPKFAKKLVKREIMRVVTPGTATEAGVLSAKENSYLAAVSPDGNRVGLAYVDVTTGEFRATEMFLSEMSPALEALNPREILYAGASSPPAVNRKTCFTAVEDWVFDPAYAERALCEHFRLLALEGCGLGGKKLAVGAAGAILHYLRETQKSALEHLDRPSWYDRGDALILDPATVRNLELIEPLFADGPKEGTLVHVLDQTMTAMGARLLRKRILRPALDRAEIESRLDAVETLLQKTIERSEMRRILGGILDLERLLSRVALGTANPREMLALGRSLAQVPLLKQACLSLPGRLGQLAQQLDEVAEVREQILNALADHPPVNLADGGLIRDGFHAELDELRDLSRNSKQYIALIEQRERTRTGIASLKVRFNHVFGYYIEISKANLHLAPADYERKQTLVNAERFTTPELKELERKILEAEDRIRAIEKEVFSELRAAAAAQASRIRATAAAIAELDLTAALAQVAAENRFSRPRFSDSGRMDVRGARHPVIEKLAEAEGARFIPNDVYLDPASKFIAVITGPNMGGKSTYLRQCALLIILAQLGSFVPADRAELPLTDRVFTRVGASDNLARGRSTFMVEMTETAAILNTATSSSFIVLDEVGRGTATYDGMALAWAVIEHIHNHIRAKTLFATHYHELTDLAEHLSGVANLQVAVKESGDQILFLRKVLPGSADKSYGIEVARLAALPLSVIERARQILKLHEKTEHALSDEISPKLKPGPVQISMFEPVGYQLAERIRSINLDQMRPIEALQLLEELQKELKRN